jgi:dipeptidase
MRIRIGTGSRAALVVILAAACLVPWFAVRGRSDAGNPLPLVRTSKSCTSFAAGKLATSDGSVMAGHTLDGSFDFRVKKISAASYPEGEKVRIDYPGIEGGWKHIVRGMTQIPQVSETYAFFSSDCPFANEHQVFFGENTCMTRTELRMLDEPQALLDWTQVAALGLQRGKTAREAILAAGALVEKYGLNGDGESFLVADPREAWCFEIPGFTREWVAERIPDDQVCPHANRMRIGAVDLGDSAHFLGSPALIQTARDRGFYNPAKDGAFNFAKAYNDEGESHSPGNRLREWRILSLLCPSKKWDPDAQSYPFSVRPEKKISAQWWLSTIWRDNLEGTPYDMTKGPAAGPYGSPEQPPVQGLKSSRSISIGEMSYSWVSQSRSWLPDDIGGVFWLGLDSSRSTCYTRFHVGVSQVPESYQTGDYTRLSDRSAFWVYQRLDTLSLARYRDMHKDIRSALNAIEDEAFQGQDSMEKEALALYQDDPEQAREFLTKRASALALKAQNSARELFDVLSARYRDGLPRTILGDDWLRSLCNR